MHTLWKTEIRMRVREPATFAQLCVLAREQITAAPTIDNFEWSERIKDRLVRLGFQYPDPPHRMTDAMDAVERALTKEWGRRPVQRSLPRQPSWKEREILPKQVDPPWSSQRPGERSMTPLRDLLADVIAANQHVTPEQRDAAEGEIERHQGAVS